MNARFNPSPYSYGADEALVETPAPEAEEKGSADYLNVVLPIAKTILGIGDTEDPAVLKAQIENYQRKYDNLPTYLRSTVGSVYLDNINKLKAKLSEARRAQEEDKTSSQLYMAMRVGGVLAVFTGVLILGGVAINQIQKARLKSAEIEHLRRTA